MSIPPNPMFMIIVAGMPTAMAVGVAVNVTDWIRVRRSAGRGTIRAMLTRVTQIEADVVHVVSNRRPLFGGYGRAVRAAREALATIHPDAVVGSPTYAGRDPSIRQVTPYRYLVTYARPRQEDTP